MGHRLDCMQTGLNQPGQLGSNNTAGLSGALSARTSMQMPKSPLQRPTSVPKLVEQFDKQRAIVWKSRARMYYPQKTPRAGLFGTASCVGGCRSAGAGTDQPWQPK